MPERPGDDFDESVFEALVADLRGSTPEHQLVDGFLFVPTRGFFFSLAHAAAVEMDLDGSGVFVTCEGVRVKSPLPAELLVQILLGDITNHNHEH